MHGGGGGGHCPTSIHRPCSSTQTRSGCSNSCSGQRWPQTNITITACNNAGGPPRTALGLETQLTQSLCSQRGQPCVCTQSPVSCIAQLSAVNVVLQAHAQPLGPLQWSHILATKCVPIPLLSPGCGFPLVWMLVCGHAQMHQPEDASCRDVWVTYSRMHTPPPVCDQKRE